MPETGRLRRAKGGLPASALSQSRNAAARRDRARAPAAAGSGREPHGSRRRRRPAAWRSPPGRRPRRARHGPAQRNTALAMSLMCRAVTSAAASSAESAGRGSLPLMRGAWLRPSRPSNAAAQAHGAPGELLAQRARSASAPFAAPQAAARIRQRRSLTSAAVSSASIATVCSMRLLDMRPHGAPLTGKPGLDGRAERRPPSAPAARSSAQARARAAAIPCRAPGRGRASISSAASSASYARRMTSFIAHPSRIPPAQRWPPRRLPAAACARPRPRSTRRGSATAARCCRTGFRLADELAAPA